MLLRSFELDFALCVNLNKSKVYGFNLQEDVLCVASNFLVCFVGSIPFNLFMYSSGRKS